LETSLSSQLIALVLTGLISCTAFLLSHSSVIGVHRCICIFIFGHLRVVSSPFVDHAALSIVTVFVLCLYFNVLLICLLNI